MKADYKEISLNKSNVNFLKNTLDIFDEIYSDILKILNVEQYEK